MSTAVASLFEKLGGTVAIQAVVDEFYQRVLADAELEPYFAHTDMDQQTKHQVNFISMALGGPKHYTGRSMKIAHEDLGITEGHFDLVAGHLVGALQWVGVQQDDIDQVMAAVAPLKDDIVAA